MKDSKRVILTCTVCLSRNYSTNKSSNSTKRIEIMKFCPRCNKHTLHKETKQEDNMKWFDLGAIGKEIKKIRWPGGNELLTNSVQVIIFTALSAAFFYLCLTVITWLLTMIGVLQYGRE